jgi:hypothetical protein
VTGKKVTPARPAEPLRIRGHHLLCALGFRGRGYSPEFVANMRRIVSRMRQRTRSKLVLLDSADSICAACPNLRADGACRNKKSAARVGAKDRRILRRLDLRPGVEITVAAAYRRVREAITPGLLTEKLCAKCRWRSLGYCAEGLRRLGLKG